MAITLVAHANAGAGSQVGTATTAGVDTTGATLLVVAVANYQPNFASDTISDSKGNTWRALTASAGTDSRAQLYYAYDKSGGALVVGAGHTVSVSDSYSGIVFAAFSSTLSAAPFDVENGAANFNVTGSITPTQANELVVSMVCCLNGSGFAVNSSLSIADSKNYVAAQNMGVALGWIQQGVATAINVTWTVTGTSDYSARIASFKAAAGSSFQAAWAGRSNQVIGGGYVS